MEKNNILEKGLMMFAAIMIGFFLRGVMINYYPSEKASKEVNDDPYLNEFIIAYKTLTEDYYEKLDRQKLIQDAIEGMTGNLEDIHTSYFSEEETKEFNENMESEYYGIGIEINTNDKNEVYIVSVFKDTPAFKAGLKTGDIFLKINDENVEKKTTSEIVDLIKGSKKEKDIIVVRRDKEELTFKIKKSKIEIPLVEEETFEVNNKLIGYVELSSFSEKSYFQFSKALINLEAKSIDSLLIDVRGNVGGYLDEVEKIMSLFAKNNQVIYQMKENDTITKYYSLFSSKRKYKVGILIDKGSASASEMLAAFIKEGYQGEVIGTNSFGKGSVQEIKKLPDGSMIKYTTKQWLTPLGNSVDKVGLTPTIEVVLDKKYFENPTFENDNQLQKGLEILAN